MVTGKNFFGHDLTYAAHYGNFFEKVFHNHRVWMWKKVFRIHKNKRILENGCNTGVVLVPLTLFGHDIYGIDNNPDDVKKTKAHLRGYGCSTEKVSVADARKLPFADGFFDIVLLSDLLEHTSDPKKCAAEAIRVLKPGGYIFATVPFHLHPMVAFPWIRKLLSSRKNIDEYPDVPFTFSQLQRYFPKLKLVRMKIVHFGVNIFGIFEKPQKRKA